MEFACSAGMPVEGLSQREEASWFGIAREAVQKVLRHSGLPGYRRRGWVKLPTVYF